MLKANGGLADDDLTPVLDLEWDMATVDGQKVDRWAAFSSDAISREALDWLQAVQAGTGRKPMIYTANSWWSGRLGKSQALKGYTHWIADYRQSSLNAQAPVSVQGHPFAAWQFTDVGAVSGLAATFDVNKLKSGNLQSLGGR